MFLTSPSFESNPLAEFQQAGVRSWQAVSLATESAWYLVTCNVEGEVGCMLVQTVAVACERTLLVVVAATESRHIRAIVRVSCEDGPGCWKTRVVEELWMSAEDEWSIFGPAVFRFQGEQRERDGQLRPVWSHAQRTRVYARRHALSPN